MAPVAVAGEDAALARSTESHHLGHDSHAPAVMHSQQRRKEFLSLWYVRDKVTQGALPCGAEDGPVFDVADDDLHLQKESMLDVDVAGVACCSPADGPR